MRSRDWSSDVCSSDLENRNVSHGAQAMSDFQTHTVENQPPEFAPRDLWADDVALREALAREGGEAHVERVARYGVLAGGELYALSFDAHQHGRAAWRCRVCS